MSIPPPRNGAVIRYGYLWKSDRDAGRDESAKDRPAAVLLARRDDATGRTTVFVLPITHSPPRDPRRALEIPNRTKARLGLDDDRSWIVCDEVNRFLWPGFDLRPIPGREPPTWEYGLLPKGLFDRARALFLACRAEKRIKAVSRD